MTAERIEIPITEKGIVCYMRLADIVRKRLHKARNAALEYAALNVPEAEFVGEEPMKDRKYTAVFVLPEGKKIGISYDYILKTVLEVVEVGTHI